MLVLHFSLWARHENWKPENKDVGLDLGSETEKRSLVWNTHPG